MLQTHIVLLYTVAANHPQVYLSILSNNWKKNRICNCSCMHLTFIVQLVVTTATVFIFIILINHHTPTDLLTSFYQQQCQILLGYNDI